MPPKRKDAKQGKTPAKTPVKEYELISLEEVRTRDIRYMNRLNDLRACIGLIYEAEEDVEHQKDAQYILDKWNAYLLCDGIPKPYLPPYIRLFFVKMRFFEYHESVDTTIDWLLSVDERSILTQNIFRKDLTRKTLVQEIRPNFGQEYEKNIELGLEILKRLEYYLENEKLVMQANPRIILDIVQQKGVIQQEIQDFFNRCAYRILCSEESYMENVNAITAEYGFQANNFQIHIWTLKNVPILFHFLELPCVRAKLHQLKVKIQVPYSLLEDNLTIYGLHTSFDHFSEHAKSYEQKTNTPLENFSAGIPDLHECLVSEWTMQVDIQKEVRDKMIQTRLEYEERMRLLEEEEAAKAKAKKNEPEAKDKKGKKAPKPPKEPPIITENTYPDVINDFLEKEQQQYEHFINVVYHPNVLNLNQNEINMKKYFILGGVYQLYFVKKPLHYNFNTFNMTWHENNGQLHVKKDVVVDEAAVRQHGIGSPSNLQLSPSKFKSQTQLAKSKHSMHQKTSTMGGGGGGDEGDHDPDMEVSPYFIVVFQLPPHLCLWGEPIVCMFEKDLVGYAEEEEVVVVDIPQPHHPATASPGVIPPHSPRETGAKILQRSPSRSPSRPLSRRGSASSLDPHPYVLTQHSSFNMASRVPSASNIFRSSVSIINMYRQQSEHSDSHVPIIYLDDFKLDNTFSKIQLRNIERHCMPRIISSFKFPKEVQEEENEEMRNKPKGQGGTLVRSRNEDDAMQDKGSERVFAYGPQNNPERVFPVFTKPEPIEFEELKLSANYEPYTFFELIDVLNTIKNLYKTNVKRTLDIPTFTTKQKIRKSIIKKPSTVIDRISLETKKSKMHFGGKGKGRGGKHHDKEKVEEVEHVQKLDVLHSIPSVHQKEITSEGEEEELHEQEEEVDTRKTFKYSHWSTEHIFNYIYDKKNCKMIVHTDRLGNFGFAYERYEHFPFRFWSVHPSEENPESEIIFTLETFHVKCVLSITADGYKGYVTEPTKGYVRNPVMYLVITDRIKDFKELKKRFRDRNLNIFTDHDASFYITNGYFSEKHFATEMHTYSCMAIHSCTMKFMFSQWNRLAKRRDLIMYVGLLKESQDQMPLVRVTPEEATFVEIKELCSDDLDVIKLDYALTWRNLMYYADLNHLIISISPAAGDMRVKGSNLICCIKNLLCEIRPLSFS